MEVAFIIHILHCIKLLQYAHILSYYFILQKVLAGAFQTLNEHIVIRFFHPWTVYRECGMLICLIVGVYDVINNLGSMAPRFIFLPIEESGRLFFSCVFTRGQSLQQQGKVGSDKLTESVLCSVLLASRNYLHKYLQLYLCRGMLIYM